MSSFPVTKITPSYLYVQYNDDDDLQGFIAACNTLAQSYMDWFSDIELPVYTGLTGELLDWVAGGLYDQTRPTLSYSLALTAGALNTWAMNTIAMNEGKTEGSGTVFLASDDIFKRVITWNFYKGDSKIFNVRWLKRRIQRFLQGVNGVDPGVNQTYDIRVIFGKGTLVNIFILGGAVTFKNRAFLNGFAMNTIAMNGSKTVITTNRGSVLRAAIETGALQLPFQYRYAVYG